MMQFGYVNLSRGRCYSVFFKLLLKILSWILLHGIAQNFACNNPILNGWLVVGFKTDCLKGDLGLWVGCPSRGLSKLILKDDIDHLKTGNQKFSRFHYLFLMQNIEESRKRTNVSRNLITSFLYDCECICTDSFKAFI